MYFLGTPGPHWKFYGDPRSPEKVWVIKKSELIIEFENWKCPSLGLIYLDNSDLSDVISTVGNKISILLSLCNMSSDIFELLASTTVSAYLQVGTCKHPQWCFAIFNSENITDIFITHVMIMRAVQAENNGILMGNYLAISELVTAQYFE